MSQTLDVAMLADAIGAYSANRARKSRVNLA